MKIAVTGPLADQNLGDYAMFVNNIYDLGKSHEYSIFHYSGEFVSQLDDDYFNGFKCKFTDVKFKKSFYIKPSFLSKVVNKLLSLLNLSLANVIKTPISSEILANVENYKDIEATIKQSDVLIVSGGGYFNQLWFEWARRDDLFKILAPILIAKKLHKKIVFTANGYGPFDESDKFFSDFFGGLQNATLGIRDKVLSKTYLQKLGINNDNFVDLPDDLYLINSDIVNKNLSEYTKISQQGDYVLLEFYYSLTWVKNNIDKIQSFVDSIWHNYGYRVVYMPLDHTPVTSYLKSTITSDHFNVIDFSDSYLKIEDAAHMIKNAKSVLCNRYHALVLSLENKVPVINIMKEVYDYRYYFNKNYGILTNAFDGLQFNEDDFLKIGPEDTLTWYAQNLKSIIKEQSQLFATKEYSNNKSKLKGSRDKYLEFIQQK